MIALRNGFSSLDVNVKVVRGGLGELQRCYDELLGELGAGIGSAFGMNGSVRDTRSALARRAADLASWVVKPFGTDFTAGAGRFLRRWLSCQEKIHGTPRLTWAANRRGTRASR